MTYQKSDKHIENIRNAQIKTQERRKCIYCDKDYTIGNIKKHQNYCYLNPKNIKKCPVCDDPIKNYKTSVTCSYSCSNKHFRTGPNHGNWKDSSYRTTCFHYHEKKCIICNEENIVEVHHFDGNNANNDPLNLVPLCPTHHQYLHSRYKHLIEDQVISYIKNR